MGNERSGGWPAVPIELTAEERQELERVSRLRIAPYREVIRARALLFAAAGRRTSDIGRTLGVSSRTVFTWRQEFAARRLAALRDRARAGGPRRFSPRGACRDRAYCLPETGR
jgi:hypothetical protein